MENADVKKEMRDAELRHWEVASEIGISEPTFTRWLRFPLSDDKKERVHAAIANLSAKRRQEATR